MDEKPKKTFSITRRFSTPNLYFQTVTRGAPTAPGNQLDAPTRATRPQRVKLLSQVPLRPGTGKTANTAPVLRRATPVETRTVVKTPDYLSEFKVREKDPALQIGRDEGYEGLENDVNEDYDEGLYGGGQNYVEQQESSQEFFEGQGNVVDEGQIVAQENVDVNQENGDGQYVYGDTDGGEEYGLYGDSDQIQYYEEEGASNIIYDDQFPAAANPPNQIGQTFLNPLDPSEVLPHVSNFLIVQKLVMDRVGIDWEGRNKYDIYTGNGTLLFKCRERMDCCTKCFCGNSRGFDLELFNRSGGHEMTMHRDIFIQTLCCFTTDCCCCSQRMTIKREGARLGRVTQHNIFCRPRFVIMDKDLKKQFYITGPMARPACCRDIELEITRHGSKEVVGEFTKKYNGIVTAGTDIQNIDEQSDVFEVTFPVAMPVEQKLLILAGGLLVDISLFESPPYSLPE